MQKTFKKGIFDRYDGWRVRNVDPVFGIVPYLLRTRIDSQNFFEENIPIERIERFIREHKTDLPDLTMMHVIIAAMVRLISQRPYLNRFVVWNKIFAHNDISLSLIIKRGLSDKGEETLVKPTFEPTDALQDVVRKMTAVLRENTQEGAKNSSDAVAGALNRLPSFCMRVIAWFLHNLDKIGMLPKSIHKASPWHCSMFLTNLGSLGIGPIYHHLYEFGTCSVFVAMGNKVSMYSAGPAGEKEMRRFIGLKFVSDERICDGHYYAVSMKMLRKLMANPEALLLPPKQVVIDDGVAKKPIGSTVYGDA